MGQELLVSADDRPELEEGEFHLLDLLGLEARLAADGPAVGTVSDLISGDRAAVLFEGGNWDKLVTLRLKDLQPV